MLKMTNERTVICAGCLLKYNVSQTTMYRNRRSCGKLICMEVINLKVATENAKKKQKKINNGTLRNGVPIDLKQIVYKRDAFCINCSSEFKENKMQVHHVIPVSDNGLDNLNNLVLLCEKCHVRVHQEGCEKYYGKFRSYIKSLEKTSI